MLILRVGALSVLENEFQFLIGQMPSGVESLPPEVFFDSPCFARYLGRWLSFKGEILQLVQVRIFKHAGSDLLLQGSLCPS